MMQYILYNLEAVAEDCIYEGLRGTRNPLVDRLDMTEEQELQAALKARETAADKLHLQGFGGNRYPETKREMPDTMAKAGLAFLARSAMSKLPE